MIGTTRDKELLQTLTQHATLSSTLGARTDFHFLWPTSSNVQYVSLRGAGDDRSGVPTTAQARAVDHLQSALPLLGDLCEPRMTTPLTEQVQMLCQLLAPVANQLRAKGQVATVVIATDGLPNHPPSFLQALRQLQGLPVWVVVRLCTSDGGIVDYWSSLDKQLELPLEVLDDLCGEAREVNRCNGWLTYAPQLHTARLFGLRDKLFDRLDEQPLAPTQVKQLCEKLLGCKPLPEPELDAPAFLRALEVALAGTPKVYDPLSRRMKPWVDTGRLSLKLLAWKHLGACGRCF